jgi:hypothetical protein
MRTAEEKPAASESKTFCFSSSKQQQQTKGMEVGRKTKNTRIFFLNNKLKKNPQEKESQCLLCVIGRLRHKRKARGVPTGKGNEKRNKKGAAPVQQRRREQKEQKRFRT